MMDLWMKRVAVSLTSLALMATPLTAQTGGRGFFMVGGQELDVAALNETLAANGYPTFHDRMISFGVGGLRSWGRVLLGGEGHALIGGEETTADGSHLSRMGGGYGAVHLGLDLRPSPRVSLYPLLGLGAGGLSLQIMERGTPTFDEVMASPGRTVNMVRGSLLVTAGVGLDYVVAPGRPQPRPRAARGPRPAQTRGGLAVGVRAGYAEAVMEDRWRTDYGDIAGGPGGAPAGWHLRVAIGGGGGLR
jgi:hypothetical protein